MPKDTHFWVIYDPLLNKAQIMEKIYEYLKDHQYWVPVELENSLRDNPIQLKCKYEKPTLTHLDPERLERHYGGKNRIEGDLYVEISFFAPWFVIFTSHMKTCDLIASRFCPDFEKSGKCTRLRGVPPNDTNKLHERILEENYGDEAKDPHVQQAIEHYEREVVIKQAQSQKDWNEVCSIPEEKLFEPWSKEAPVYDPDLHDEINKDGKPMRSETKFNKQESARLGFTNFDRVCPGGIEIADWCNVTDQNVVEFIGNKRNNTTMRTGIVQMFNTARRIENRDPGCLQAIKKKLPDLDLEKVHFKFVFNILLTERKARTGDFTPMQLASIREYLALCCTCGRNVSVRVTKVKQPIDVSEAV